MDAGGGRPSGTLTFLFTDIEGSTAAWSNAPDAMSTALARHDALLRAAIAEHDGVVFATGGDGVAACFRRAGEAVAAALDAQVALSAERWPEGASIAVRMGLHTGEAVERDEDYFGPVVNLAARVMGAAHGGQVVATATTAALLGPGGEVMVVKLGLHTLKGIGEPIALVGLGGRGHAWIDRPLNAPAGARLLGFPARRGELVARAELVDDVVRVLDSLRLVTLVGPGGVGKTSLAVEVAAQLADRVERAVFVDLAAVERGGDVRSAFARALGTSTATLDALSMNLGSGRVLLVCDNCEHVVDEVADTVDALLAAAPGARVLATTREPLEVTGERVVTVPPLADDGALLALFVERAAEVGAPAIASDDHPSVLEVCRRLDGLPLAIELAAARTVALSVREILDRLDDRLTLLGSGRRRGRDRHRTLRETIAWSVQLLDEPERHAYTRLAVFVDWFDLDDAAAVTGLDRRSVLDVVQGLVSKSLLLRSERFGRARFRYLESVREHALGELDAVGDTVATMNRMVDRVTEHLAALARRVWEDPAGPPVDEIEALLPNHRLAADWCIERRDLDRGAALFLALADTLMLGFPHAMPPVLELADIADITQPAWLPLRAVATLAEAWSGRFADCRRSLLSIEAVLGSWSELPARLFLMVAYSAGTVGLDAIVNADGVPAQLEGGRAIVARTSALTSRVLHGLGDEGDLDRIMGLLPTKATPFARLCSLMNGLMVAAVVAPHRIPEIAAETELVCPDLPLQQWRLECMAEWHLERGELVEAIQTIAPTIDLVCRLGERSALVPRLVLHALVLQRLDRPEDAARVSGAMPRRWAAYHTRFVDSFHTWLEASLDDDTRRRLAAEGAATDPLELLTIAPRALGLA